MIKQREDFAVIAEKIESFREDMVRDLADLVRCRSVLSEAEENAPFGRGVAEAYSRMLKMGEREGFDVFDCGGYGGHIDFGGPEKNGVMGILCHLDVVAEGNGWHHDPFGACVEDGVMYGRGTLDDKGPAIAAFYAMKALKECGIIPEKRVRLVLGLDEETGSIGMEHYKQKVSMPDFAIVPDSDFPLVNGEMGILIFDLVRRTGKADKGGISLKRLTGGNAPNMVPDSACAVIMSENGYDGVKTAAARFSEETGYSVTTKGRGKRLEILCGGKSAHGAMPQKGINAVSVLMRFLGELDFDSSGINDFIRFYNRHIGFGLSGEQIGCGKLKDDISGSLIWNTGMLFMDSESVCVTVNVRCPVSFCDEDVYAAIRPVVEPYEIGIVKKMYKAPLYYSTDSDIVRTLLDVYRDGTGDRESQPLVIGGGTYAREMENAVAFGALYPGDPDIMHEPEECIRIDRLVQTAGIYADAICRLADAAKDDTDGTAAQRSSEKESGDTAGVPESC